MLRKQLQALEKSMSSNPFFTKLCPNDKKRIGEGTFGKVYHVEEKILLRICKTKVDGGVAIKQYHDQESAATCVQEQKGLAIDHENLIPGFILQEREQFFVIMPKMHATLADLRRRVELKEALEILMQMLCGLEALHNLGMLHGDIKCTNILCNPNPSDGHVRIADFGGITMLKDAGSDEEKCIEVATPEYRYTGLLAATLKKLYERAEGNLSSDSLAYGREVDFFAAGVVWLKMRLGYNPFCGPTCQKNVDDDSAYFQMCEEILKRQLAVLLGDRKLGDEGMHWVYNALAETTFSSDIHDLGKEDQTRLLLGLETLGYDEDTKKWRRLDLCKKRPRESEGTVDESLKNEVTQPLIKLVKELLCLNPCECSDAATVRLQIVDLLPRLCDARNVSTTASNA